MQSNATSARSEFVRERDRIRKTGNVFRGLRRMRLTQDPRLLYRISAFFAADPSYRSFVLPAAFPKRVDELRAHSSPYISSYENEFAWRAGIVLAHAESLSRYVRARRIIENVFLTGDPADVGSLLDDIEADIGTSLWLIENRICFSQATGGHSQRKEFVDTVLTSKAPGIVKQLSLWFSLRCNAAITQTSFDRMLSDLMSDDFGFPFIVNALNGKYYDLKDTQLAEMISYSDNLAVVDQYEILLKVAQIRTCREDHVNDRDDITGRIICELSQAIEDPRLQRIASCYGGTNAQPVMPHQFVDVLDYYANGDYAAIKDITNSLDLNLLTVEHISILSRISYEPNCADTLQILENTGTIAESIAHDLAHILNFSTDALEARQRLQKIILTYCNFSWAASLSLILIRQANDERVFPAERSQRLAALNVLDENPLIAFCLPGEESCVSYINKLRLQHPTSHAISSVAYIAGLAVSDSELASLLDERRTRISVYKATREGNFAESSSLLADLLPTMRARPTRGEAAVQLCHSMLREDDTIGAAELAASLYLESSYFGIVLPIRSLIDQIMVEHNAPFRNSKTRGRKSIAIIFDAYSRLYSSDRDAERADAYKDVLRRDNVDFASELVRSGIDDDTAKLEYFLRYICVPDVLDQSLALDSPKAVEDERIAVLISLNEMLINSNRNSPDELKEEIREIQTRQVVRETSEKLDQSKIYVHVESIRKSFDIVMRDSWNRYQAMKAYTGDTLIENIQRILRTAVGDSVTFLTFGTPLAESRTILTEMVLRIRDQFANNKEFGLNSNLSTNIRHGYILQELRGPLFSRQLVTNKESDSGQYRANNYWLERFDHDEPKRAAVSAKLDKLSRKIDDLIDKLNRHTLRIRSETCPDGLFVYDMTDTDIAIVESRVDKVYSYDDFVDVVISYLWERTQYCLSSIRSTLETSTLSEFIALIDETDLDLREIGVEEHIPAIHTSLSLVKGEMRSAVERVSSWFTLSSSTEYHDYELELAFQAGIRTVKSYYKNVAINETFLKTKPIQMKGWTLPHLARLFFLLFDNAAEHGAAGRDSLRIDVAAESSQNSLYLHLRNDIGSKADLPAVQSKARTINSDYGQTKSIELLGEEGGSGYPKIWKLLRSDLGRTHDLDVSVADGNFNVQILIDSRGVVA